MKRLSPLGALFLMVCLTGCDQKEEEDPTDMHRMVILEEGEDAEWDLNQALEDEAIAEEIAPEQQEMIVIEEPEAQPVR